MSETRRCEVCDWPLKNRMEDGCIEGNCSYRPHEGTAEYFRIRKRREELAAKKADASICWFEPAEPVIEVALASMNAVPCPLRKHHGKQISLLKKRFMQAFKHVRNWLRTLWTNTMAILIA